MNSRRTTPREEIPILVVEDSPTQAVMLESLLIDEGYAVTVAQGGLEALECLKGSKPSLVISDIVMPNMDGYELCRTIKSDPELKDIPVILLTALTEPGEVINGLKCGADNFINKPYKSEFLLSQISHVLANQELRRSRYFELGIEIFFAGEKHYITSDRIQIVDLLLSTFENAVVKNRELGEAIGELHTAQANLQQINESLEELVRERTQRISHLNNVLRAVRSINRLIVRERDPEHLIQEACDTLIRTRGYDAAWIVLIDPETGKQITGAAESMGSDRGSSMIAGLREGVLPPCTEIAKQRPGSVVIMDGQSPECSRCSYADRGKTGMTMITEILYGERLKGFLSLHVSAPTTVDEEEESLLQEVSGDIGFALHDINLERAHEKNFADLQKSEAQYRLHFENVSDVIFSVDRDYRFISITPSVKAVLGYDPEQVIGRTVQELGTLAASSLSAAMHNLNLIFAGEHVYPTVYEFTALDGTSRYMEVLTSPIMTDGEIRSALSIGRDITERKVVEEWLLQQRTMTERIMQTTPSGIMLFDREGLVTFINPRGCEILGIPPEVLHGQKRRVEELHLQDPSGGEITAAGFPSTLILAEGRSIHGVDLALQNPGGRDTFLLINGAPVLDSAGNIHEVVLSFDDITERKQAEEDLEATAKMLRRAVNTTVQVLALAVESKDPYTAGHQRRTTELASAIATEMKLPAEKIEGLRMAGNIHDIGKISTPSEILSKPSRLSEIEYRLIQAHAEQGFEILKDVESPWPLAEIVHQHHERLNGTGYPKGLKGDEILLEARILAAADVLESMASHRPYRPALGIEAALAEIEQNKGILYDPNVVESCLRLFREKGYRLP